MTTLEAIDHEIDDDLPLLAGRKARYVTTPHGWPVNRIGYDVTATKGRLTVRFGKYPRIDDDEHVVEDETTYGVPTSAAEARALAALYEEAEAILAAYKAGEYVPPPALRAYRDNQPRGSSWLLSSMTSYLTGTMNMMSWLDPLVPYTRQEKFENIWRRMRGEEPIPQREKTRGDGSGKMRLVIGDDLT